MLRQILFRLEHSVTLFGGDVNQRSCGFNFSLVWLQLSHALDAVGSPCAAQEFDDRRPALQNRGQGKAAFTVGRSQRKSRRPVADLQGFALALTAHRDEKGYQPHEICRIEKATLRRIE